MMRNDVTQPMTDKLLKGTWRSYKVFYASGGVKKHSSSSFMEIGSNEQGAPAIKPLADHPYPAVLRDSAWEIREQNNKRYFCLQGKPAYEVLTLDENDLVLADLVKGEKIFFAPLPEWSKRIHAELQPAEADVSITIWSKSLIQLIQK